MARHKSAQKRARQDLKRREHNRGIRAKARSVVKTLRSEIDSGAQALETKLREAEGALRRAASKLSLIHI